MNAKIETESGNQITMVNSGNSANTSLKFPKPITKKNPKYKKWISSLPCLITQRPPPNDPHHVPLKGHGSKGAKTDDTRCIPLAHHLHVEAHNIGRDSFAKKYGIDYEYVIGRLNKIYEAIGKEGENPQRNK